MQQQGALHIAQADTSELFTVNQHHELQKLIGVQVHTELKSALQSMVNHSDHYVLELVDESCNIGDQAQISDAMRLVNLQKKSMLSEYLAFFDESYTKQIVSNQCAGLSINDYLYNDDAHGQSLVKNEMLEIRAAVDKMSDRIKRRQWQLQSTLTKRFSVLAGHRFDVNSYPISPWIICESFAKVVGRLKTRFSRKLIIIKMFEHSAIPVLENLYKQIDSLLIKNNISQNVENIPCKIESPDGQDRSLSELDLIESNLNSVSTSELDYNVKRFVAMQQMLHNDVKENLDVEKSDADIGKPEVNIYPVDDVMTGLSVLQEKVLMLDHTECIALNSHVKPNLFKLLKLMSDPDVDFELDRKCSDVIDIVSMMFDFILDDAALPLQLRTVIIRLQVPIIKVAILDDEFFNSRLQSARQLLNELAYSANVLNLVNQPNDSSENFVIAKAERVVDTILTSFTLELDMFTTELRNFQQFVRAALKGRMEKTKQLQVAKDVVIAEIKQRLTSQSVPAVVEVFIKQVWNNVLTKVGLATQCEGKSWRAILQITDELIWSTQPKQMDQERKLLTNMIPRLLSRLQEGLNLVEYNKSLTGQFFQQLEQVHLNSLRGLKADAANHNKVSLRDKNIGYHYKDSSVGMGMSSVLTDLNNHVKKSDLTIASRSSTFFLGMPDSELMLNPSYVTVNEMTIGTWVAFLVNDRTSIGKLEWKCDYTEEYRFVDRNCTVVHSANLHNLVKLFDQSKARIIDDIPLFDRAVDAVYNELQVA